MKVDLSEWLGRHIYVTGEYEQATSTVISTLLKRGGTFIDIGANAGYFTLLAAKSVGPEGVIYSFEPLPTVRERLQLNIQLNRFTNCKVYESALSKSNGTANFNVGPRNHPGLSSLRSLNSIGSTIEVETRCLDDIIPHDQEVHLCKIDVEGAECLVLEGMQSILNRCRPDIVIEISPEYLASFGYSVNDVEALIEPYGYRFYAIEHRRLRHLSRLIEYPKRQYNAFLTTASIPHSLIA